MVKNDFTTRSKEELSRINSQSGRKSEGAKERYKIQRLKKMSPEDLEKRGLEILNSPQRFDIEMLYLIQEMLKKDLPDKTKLDLINKMTQVKTAVWGNKTYNANVNVDANEMMLDKILNRFREYKSSNIKSPERQEQVLEPVVVYSGKIEEEEVEEI